MPNLIFRWRALAIEWMNFPHLYMFPGNDLPPQFYKIRTSFETPSIMLDNYISQRSMNFKITNNSMMQYTKGDTAFNHDHPV